MFKQYRFKKEDKSKQKIQYFLAPSYINEAQLTNGKKETFVFINDINLYLHHAKIDNAIVKIRKQLCKEMNIEYIDIDYFEVNNLFNKKWKDINQMTTNDQEKVEKQVEDYLKLKFIKSI